jgi:hypothetical protein
MKLLKVGNDEYTLEYRFANKSNIDYCGSIEKLSVLFTFLNGNLNELEKGLISLIQNDHNRCFFDDRSKNFMSSDKI